MTLRPHYLSAVTAVRNLPAQIQPTGSYWLISQGARNPAGQLIEAPEDQPVASGVPISSLPRACGGLLGRGRRLQAPPVRRPVTGPLVVEPLGEVVADNQVRHDRRGVLTEHGREAGRCHE